VVCFVELWMVEAGGLFQMEMSWLGLQLQTLEHGMPSGCQGAARAH
jgi:hypothetical protein